MKSAKSTKSIKSIKSMRSVRSMKSGLDFFDDDDDELRKFEDILPSTCMKFSCPVPVVVKKDYQRDTFLKMLKHHEKTKYKKISVVTPLLHAEPSNLTIKKDNFPDITPSGVDAGYEPGTIIVTALYDNMNRLAEIYISRARILPRVIIQTIGLLAPFYDRLTKLSIVKSGINSYTIYELKKMLPMTKLSDICLDDCPLSEGNYAILLEQTTHLRNLSLCRCKINDNVCREIASKLHYTTPAEKQLLLLNLSTNHITNVGAKYLYEALRTNRHLRYLNLADNRIGDDGASYIFSALIEFPLTTEEVLDKQKRYMDYLRVRMSIYIRYLHGIDDSTEIMDHTGKKQAQKKKKHDSHDSRHDSKNKSSSKNKVDPPLTDYLRTRAEVLAGEVMGPFTDPYSNSFVKIKDEWSYCNGNMVLCYLNVAYNDLTYLSLKKLLDVLTYQSKTVMLNQTGLLKVIVDGNYMPEYCPEMSSITTLLNKNMSRYSGKSYGDGRRKSRTLARVSTLPDMKHREK